MGFNSVFKGLMALRLEVPTVNIHDANPCEAALSFHRRMSAWHNPRYTKQQMAEPQSDITVSWWDNRVWYSQS